MRKKDFMKKTFNVAGAAALGFASGVVEELLDTSKPEPELTLADFEGVEPFKVYNRIVQPAGYEASDFPTEEV